jgi:hypothetical protein
VVCGLKISGVSGSSRNKVAPAGRNGDNNEFGKKTNEPVEESHELTRMDMNCYRVTWRFLKKASPEKSQASAQVMLGFLRQRSLAFLQQVTNGSSFALNWVLNRQFLSNGRWK